MLLILVLIVSAFAINFKGVEYGLEFTGGTYYQIQLEEKVTPQQMDLVTSIISQRVDAFGLRDTKVNALGEDIVAVQIAETDPERIAQIEALLKTQARFESTIDGNLLFRGSDLLTISRNPASGYGVSEQPGGFEWRLPFTLTQEAATRFSHGVFHKCTPTGFGQGNRAEYDCEYTYFFIDRPDDAAIVIPASMMQNDERLLAAGNEAENINAGLSVDGLMSNAGASYIVVPDSNLGQGETERLSELALTKSKAIIPPSATEELRDKLSSLGFKVNEVVNEKENVPWVWVAVGARQVIALNEDITNMAPYVDDIRKARIFSELSIRGLSPSRERALQDLKGLEVLLESGSLPIGIESISKETISPLLGKEFFSMAVIMGIAALLLVSIVLFVRYRRPRITMPIIFVALSEAFITVGVSTLLGVRLDLASVAGVIAAIGTGLNDQIVIIDEMLKGGADTVNSTYTNRIKKAFFIVVAAAATIVAALAPILFLASYGFGKLAGFALTTIIGVFMGVLVTRPAFSVISEFLLKSEKPRQG